MVKSTSYWIQYAWGNHPIKQIHDANLSTPTSSSHVYHSFGSDDQGKLVAKLINTNVDPKTVEVQLESGGKLSLVQAKSWQIKGSYPQAANTLSDPQMVTPQNNANGPIQGTQLGSDGILRLSLPTYSASVLTLPLA